jgi:hypothetical protein
MFCSSTKKTTTFVAQGLMWLGGNNEFSNGVVCGCGLMEHPSPSPNGPRVNLMAKHPKELRSIVWSPTLRLKNIGMMMTVLPDVVLSANIGSNLQNQGYIEGVLKCRGFLCMYKFIQ